MAVRSLSNESVDVVVQRVTHLLADLEDRLPALGELYRDLHRHPELSLQEHRTAGIVAQHLRKTGYEVTVRLIGINLEMTHQHRFNIGPLTLT